MTPRALLGLIPGEPAGIGPELCVRLAQTPHAAQLVAICDGGLLMEAAQAIGLPLDLVSADSADVHPGQLRLLHRPRAVPSRFGTLDPRNAKAVHDALIEAAQLAGSGTLAGLVTGPVHKAVLNEAGIAYTGTTELLAKEAGREVVMMLASSRLRVALATTHLPLRAVPGAISRASLTDTIEILHAALLADFGIPSPVIAVLGLNPHAGEAGYLGHEELEVIEPVLEQLRTRGMQLIGPLPADTAFLPGKLAGFDAVLAMYHDQGLPVLKFSGFEEAVNITLGLPYVRVAVDHGTALELAGRGLADASSMILAAQWATAFAERRDRLSPRLLA
ncbi:4-hydroxythreonine-4-phosphate dehydrogenase PdxA [Xanthomonadaceae bacterium XH05]|nr:4-hydroxythreonine-4-phosphate dehydrogenase PdxA [Xanthomonadaceae bacterium XH05]